MDGKCFLCRRPLLTGDVDGLCCVCRQRGIFPCDKGYRVILRVQTGDGRAVLGSDNLILHDGRYCKISRVGDTLSLEGGAVQRENAGNCPETGKCPYCDSGESHKPLYHDGPSPTMGDFIDVSTSAHTGEPVLSIDVWPGDENLTLVLPIRYCPMCGRPVEGNKTKEAANAND